MAHDHSHVPAAGGHERLVWIALALTTTILVAELFGAWLTQSLALLSGAAHMLTDAAALTIARRAARVAAIKSVGHNRLNIRAGVPNVSS